MTDALRAKEWLEQNTIYKSIHNVISSGLPYPDGVSWDRHWFIEYDGMTDYWNDETLIAFARSKGFEGGEG